MTTTHQTFQYAGLRVRFQDVDHAGIAFFARFYEYCHVAYEEFVEDVLGLGPRDFFEIKSYGAPLVATGSSHHHPLFHGDQVVVSVWVEALGRKSMTMRYTIDNGDGVRCAELWTKHAFVDGKTMKAITIPQGIRERLLPYLASGTEEEEQRS